MSGVVIDGHVEVVHEEPDIEEHLWPTQRQAFETEANEILFGGAKGPGKSFLLRFASIVWACECPGINIYLFRREYPDLKANHMEGPKSYHNLCARMVNRGLVSIIPHEVRFWNGSKIFLNHLQHSRYLGKYQGPEMHVAMFDEVTQFEEEQYRYIRGSLRMGSFRPPSKYLGRDFFPRIMSGANPGGVGHAWVKRTFVDHGANVLVDCKTLPRSEDGENEGPHTRVFVPARAEDNPSLLTYDPDYLDRVEAMGNPALVLAMREGNWDIVVGSMFGYVFRVRRHVCKPFPIPVTWDIWRGGDDGFNSPASVHWITQDPDTGTFYVIAELYAKQMLPDDFAERTLRIDRRIQMFFGGMSDMEIGDNDMPLDGEMDSAAFADTGTNATGKSRGEQLNKLGCKWRPVAKTRTTGVGFRVMRAQLMHSVLAPNKLERRKDALGEPLPGIQIFPGCVNLIRTIPQLPIDRNNAEDVDTDAEDHAYDSVTYGLLRKRSFFKQKKLLGL